MRKLLWVGDAACPSGFALATHKTLETLRRTFDVTVLGLNYRGDPHTYPYPIYAAAPGGDSFGIGRLIWMCDLVKPDVIVLQNDPWNIRPYLQQLQRFEEYKDIPVIASVAVDGKNCVGSQLNGLAMAIFWTYFGLDEARAGGYTGPATVIPLGVDLSTYYPMDKYDARLRKGLPREFDDVFIVGNVNRNQPRKRWDLCLKYFAEWIKDFDVKDAYLYLHVCPTGDMGVQVKQLALYYGILERLLLVEPPVFYGVSEDSMRETYNCFDVQINTGQGEGFGLTAFEGAACGVPLIASDWAALGELMKGAASLIWCSSTHIGPPYVNVLGGVMDKEACITTLNTVYEQPEFREDLKRKGLTRVSDPRFRWEHIGEEFQEAVDLVLRTPLVAEVV